MTGEEAKAALVKGLPVNHGGWFYTVTAIIYRRLEMDSIGIYAELTDEKEDEILRSADGERLEVPITELKLMTGGNLKWQEQ